VALATVNARAKTSKSVPSERPGLGYLLGRLWHHLGRRRRRQFAVLFVLMLVSAFAEVISLSAVLPFIGILAVPEKAMAQPVVAVLASSLGIDSAEQLVFPLTLVFAIAAIVAAGVRLLVTWLSTRLTFASGADISIEVYRRALYQPYRVHVRRNTSEMISGITGKVGHTTLGVLLPLLTLLSSGVLLVAIISTLLAVDPFLATVAAAGFGLSYALITWVSRRRLRRNSEHIARENTKVIKALQEGLGGIRDVLLNGSQQVYCDVYREADRRWRLAQGENVFIGQSPRFAMEALGMVLIASLAYALSRQPGGLVVALPVLGLLALGAQRLLPVMQQVYRSWASIAGSYASFADTVELLDQPLPAELLLPAPSPLILSDAIRFDNVDFRYSDDGPWVLNDVCLTIPSGSRVGFVGSTGSGKSTLIDLLMGLLEPTRGRITVDGLAIEGDRIRAWQQALAHVPQNIFLADATLSQNIAIGVRPEDIDHERVRNSARKAQISALIESMPDGYESIVGERGVRLSGGQRQRIGIARALYREASVLVLDEATSALDNETERSVMDAIRDLDRQLTILIIAHRLTSVRHCDFIVELDRGRVAAQGEYERLLQVSDGFRRLAQAVIAK